MTAKKQTDQDIVQKVRETLAKKNETIGQLREKVAAMESALEDARRELVRAKEVARSHDSLIDVLSDILTEDAAAE